MKINAIDIFRMDRPGMCLNGSYDIMLPGFLVHVKNPQGFPIDLRRVDANWVYDQLTEGDPPRGWLDPNAVKLHIGNQGRGNRICPAVLDTDKFPYTTYEDDSPFLILTNGAWDFNIHSVLGTKYVLNAAVMHDWKGDIKNVLTYRLDYFWGGKKLDALGRPSPNGQWVFPNLEEYFYPQPFWGLANWTHSTLRNGIYVKDGDSGVANTLQAPSWYKVGSFGWKLPLMVNPALPWSMPKVLHPALAAAVVTSPAEHPALAAVAAAVKP